MDRLASLTVRRNYYPPGNAIGLPMPDSLWPIAWNGRIEGGIVEEPKPPVVSASYYLHFTFSSRGRKTALHPPSGEGRARCGDDAAVSGRGDRVFLLLVRGCRLCQRESLLANSVEMGKRQHARRPLTTDPAKAPS